MSKPPAPSTPEVSGYGRNPLSVGHSISAENARWNFGGSVPETFECHIEQSVPGYRDGHGLIAALSDFFLYDGALVYELGCSTAALSRKLAAHNSGKLVRIVGLEIDAAMAEAARRNCLDFPAIEIREVDVCDFEFEPADLIAAYYTIQFIRPDRRQKLFDKVYQSLKWGGAFVVFEKVRAPDARFQDIMGALYTDYKLKHGFTEVEIVQKARSLKGVLEPFSSKANQDFLERSGFVDYMTIWKNICFEGIVAIK